MAKRRGTSGETHRKDVGLEALQACLRDAGLRSTGPRIAVLRQLVGRAGPVSHAELCHELREHGLDRATLYRNLIDLADVGIVSRIDLGDHVWRFELTSRSGDHEGSHPHFVCSDCGTVSCLTDSTVRIVRGKRAPKSLATKSVAIRITATCDTCAGR